MSDRPDEAAMMAQINSYHMHVGRVCSQAAVLDLLIDKLIWTLMDCPPLLVTCLTSQIPSVFTKLRSLIAILELLEDSQPHIKAINKFASSPLLRATIDHRNRIIHDAWGVSGDAANVGQLQKAIVGKNVKLGIVDFDKARLIENIQEFSELIEQFTEISENLDAWLTSSPKKWREPFRPVNIGYPEILAQKDA